MLAFYDSMVFLSVNVTMWMCERKGWAYYSMLHSPEEKRTLMLIPELSEKRRKAKPWVGCV